MSVELLLKLIFIHFREQKKNAYIKSATKLLCIVQNKTIKTRLFTVK